MTPSIPILSAHVTSFNSKALKGVHTRFDLSLVQNQAVLTPHEPFSVIGRYSADGLVKGKTVVADKAVKTLELNYQRPLLPLGGKFESPFTLAYEKIGRKTQSRFHLDVNASTFSTTADDLSFTQGAMKKLGTNWHIEGNAISNGRHMSLQGTIGNISESMSRISFETHYSGAKHPHLKLNWEGMIDFRHNAFKTLRSELRPELIAKTMTNFVHALGLDFESKPAKLAVNLVKRKITRR